MNIDECTSLVCFQAWCEIANDVVCEYFLVAIHKEFDLKLTHHTAARSQSRLVCQEVYHSSSCESSDVPRFLICSPQKFV